MTILNVLLVDDEAVFTETLAERLQGRGVAVATAASGPEALRLSSENRRLDVVALDVAMPGMDGLETLLQLKKHHPLVEVIMITGRATVGTAVAAMKHGAFDYVEKPVDIDVLLSMMTNAAARKRDRERRIQDIRIMPYISERDRDTAIRKVLEA